MIVGQILGYILLTIIALGVTVFFFWLFFVKNKFNEKLWVIAILPGVLVWLILWGSCTLDIVVFNGDQSVEHYMAFISGTIETSDGQKIHVHRFNGNDSFIINNSDAPLAVETASYGMAFNFETCPQIIPAHRALFTYKTPDYFFEDSPPSSISVDQGIKSSMKTWLRFASDDELKKCISEDNLIPDSAGK